MSWTSLNLHKSATDKPPFATFSPGSYVFLNPDGVLSQHIVYQGYTSLDGSDGRVHELWANTDGVWHHHDLFADADGNPSEAAGQPFTGYSAREAVGGKRTQHINYLGVDGAIHELWWDDDGWHHRSLSGDVGAPAGLTTPKGYVFGSDQHVIYVGIDFHIHDLHWHDGTWKHTDLTANLGGALAQGVPSAYVCDFQNTQHVHYRGVDQHIYELQGVEGAWAPAEDRTALSGGPQVLAKDNPSGDPSGYVLDFQGTQHVVYRGINGHLYEFRWSEDRWVNHDLTSESPNDVPPALDGGSSVGYVFEQGERQYINFTGADSNVNLVGWQGGVWETAVPTPTASAIPTVSNAISNPTGYIFPPTDNSPRVAYNSADHEIILLSLS